MKLQRIVSVLMVKQKVVVKLLMEIFLLILILIKNIMELRHVTTGQVIFLIKKNLLLLVQIQ